MDTVYAPVPVAVEASGTRRWSLSVEWVAAAARIRTNDATGAWVATVSVVPGAALEGTPPVMTGRGLGDPSASSRYGGVKTAPSAWLVAQSPHRPPPPEKIRPSGSRLATLW